MRAWYKQLIAVRRAHPALRRGERTGLEFGKDHMVFHRHDPLGGEHLLVAVNRGDAEAAATVTLPAGWPAGGVSDLLDGATFTPRDGILDMTIPARGLRILAVAP
jgi:alpha-amylase